MGVTVARAVGSPLWRLGSSDLPRRRGMSGDGGDGTDPPDSPRYGIGYSMVVTEEGIVRMSRVSMEKGTKWR